MSSFFFLLLPYSPTLTILLSAYSCVFFVFIITLHSYDSSFPSSSLFFQLRPSLAVFFLLMHSYALFCTFRIMMCVSSSVSSHGLVCLLMFRLRLLLRSMFVIVILLRRRNMLLFRRLMLLLLLLLLVRLVLLLCLSYAQFSSPWSSCVVKVPCCPWCYVS